MEVTYQGDADRVVPFPDERPDLVFTGEESTLDVPNALAERLQKEPGNRWRIEGEPAQEQSTPAVPTGLAEAIANRTVDEVMDWVGDSVERARQARRAETARDEDEQRSTLLEQIDDVLEQ